jgi:hypothetical protein
MLGRSDLKIRVAVVLRHNGSSTPLSWAQVCVKRVVCLKEVHRGVPVEGWRAVSGRVGQSELRQHCIHPSLLSRRLLRFCPAGSRPTLLHQSRGRQHLGCLPYTKETMLSFNPPAVYQASKCYATHGVMGHLDPKQPPFKSKPWTTLTSQDFVHRVGTILVSCLSMFFGS